MAPHTVSDEMEEENVEANLADIDNNEQDVLLPRPTTRDDRSLESSAPSLLFLMGPALLSGIIVRAFDIAFLATIYTNIASELHHFTDGTWILFAASICSAICVPLYSCMLNIFGVKRLMITAYGAYAIGSGLCGMSGNFWQLLCSRTVLGFGSGGITLLTMVVINEIVGVRQLPIWQSLVTGVEMVTSIAAGPIGAWVYRRFSWHAIFYLQFVFMLGALGILIFSLFKVKNYSHHSQSLILKKGSLKIPRIDVEGLVLLASTITIPLVAFTLADHKLNWTNPIEVTLLVISPVVIFAFVYYEAKFAPAPIVNMAPVFNPRYAKVLFSEFFIMFILNAIVYTIPPYIQARAIEGSTFSDWALSCVFLGYSTGAVLGGFLIKTRIIPIQRLMLVNAITLLIFCALFVSKAIKPESAHSAPLLVGFGVCTGIWQSCLLYASLANTQKDWQAQALALYYLTDMFGGNLGMTLMATITRSVAKSDILSILGPSNTTKKIIDNALKDLNSIRKLEPDVRDKVAAAFEHGMHSAFFIPVAMAIIVILLITAMGPEVLPDNDED